MGESAAPGGLRQQVVVDETAAGVRQERGSGVAASWPGLTRTHRLRVAAYGGYVVMLTLLFIQPLAGLMVYAAGSDLHSHIVLVPWIVGYLLYTQRYKIWTPPRGSIGEPWRCAHSEEPLSRLPRQGKAR
jgi:hypothetical protein